MVLESCVSAARNAVQCSAARYGFRLGGKRKVKIAWCLGVSVHVHGADQ